MKGVKTIRAVERSFEVLRALRELKDASVAQLQQRTGLSRPTLLRILKTLIEQGVVRRGLKDQRFRNCLSLGDLTERLSPGDWLADIAAPVLVEQARTLRWPSVLGVYDQAGPGDCMVVLESTVAMTPFYVRRIRKDRVSILASSLGGAFLAQLAPAQLELVLDRVRLGGDPHNLNALAQGDLAQRLAVARERGYALRNPRYLGGTYQAEERDDGLNSVAVPLVADGAVFGALGLNWNRKAMTEEDVATQHVPRLRETAAAIAGEAQARGVAAALALAD